MASPNLLLRCLLTLCRSTCDFVLQPEKPSAPRKAVPGIHHSPSANLSTALERGVHPASPFDFPEPFDVKGTHHPISTLKGRERRGPMQAKTRSTPYVLVVLALFLAPA